MIFPEVEAVDYVVPIVGGGKAGRVTNLRRTCSPGSRAAIQGCRATGSLLGIFRPTVG